MSQGKEFEIQRFGFTKDIFRSFANIHYANDLWPIVYILSNEKIKKAYVGETTDVYSRTDAHLKSEKRSLTDIHLITCNKFNKSATLDIEANLIKYISGDGKYELLNGNLGLVNHTYYDKQKIYWPIFESIWDKLIYEGVARHSIEYISNSNLFKYSPYKSLTRDQSIGLLTILESLANDSTENILIEGGAGTGKTVLATFLFKLLNTQEEEFNYKDFGELEEQFIAAVRVVKKKYPNPKMALAIPMSSFRKTIKKVFKNIKGLRQDMVIGPAEIANGKFDIVFVDESHRLRRRVNLGSYYKAFDKACAKLNLEKESSNELEWLLLQSKKLVLFYDENQSVKPSDVLVTDFMKLKLNTATNIQYLKSQLRIQGGTDYVEYISNLLNCSHIPGKKIYNSHKYSFLLFDSIEDMRREIKERNEELGLSRLIAGYSWKWKSKKNKKLFDIEIEDVKLRWNSKTEDWINSDRAIEEVGCIHTTQGYDLNYAGIIFGNEISYDKEKNEIVVLEKEYFDRNGKASIKDPAELKRFIINIYKTIMQRGIRGTYVYACDPKLREYFASFISRVKSAGEVMIVPVGRKGILSNSVELYDLKAAAGSFSDVQQVVSEAWIQMPANINASEDHFACQVIGESMNKVIPNGAICLFKKYEGGPRDGKIILVQHTSIQDKDFGSGFTVKKYHSKKSINEESWHHESITLDPYSDDSSFESIVIKEDELKELKVIGIFDRVLYTIPFQFVDHQ